MGGEGLGGAHKGVRSDDVVEVSKPKMSEQWNLNRAWEAVTYEDRSKDGGKCVW